MHLIVRVELSFMSLIICYQILGQWGMRSQAKFSLAMQPCRHKILAGFGVFMLMTIIGYWANQPKLDVQKIVISSKCALSTIKSRMFSAIEAIAEIASQIQEIRKLA